MSCPIEDYALIGDCQTAALVSRHGSIDWLCLPRFDSGACFAALLGDSEHGRWLIQPSEEIRRIRRRYRPGTLILETEFETDSGRVALIDFMPPRTAHPDLMRIVEGRGGEVPMRMELVLRPEYGSVVPWVRSTDGGIEAIAGQNGMHFHASTPLVNKNFRTYSRFTVHEGQREEFGLIWYPSHVRERPLMMWPDDGLRQTQAWWENWSNRCTYHGPWREAVVRSLITLKALIYDPTGGIIAALTTSLPEELGGTRNWDYRYCWLRDATFTLYALLGAGYTEEACAWRDWLLRAVAGKPSQLHAIYGVAGERHLFEHELPWLPGYENSRPVRAGNDAYHQLQLDVFGEVMDVLHLARKEGLHPDENAWRLQTHLLQRLEECWREPDEGIWEVRGGRQQFTHSKVMAWVAFDRAVKGIEMFGHEGPLEHWRTLRDTIHAEVCTQGFDADRNTFVQAFGSRHLDASLLMIPLVGFLPPEDPRVRGTLEAIQGGLMHNGLVYRYNTDSDVDGLQGGEATFLLCSFWMVDNLVLMGRTREAHDMFERLVGLCNDVGLLSEEYDPAQRRMLGNFPQAFSHVALINTARNLAPEQGPAEQRGEE